MSEPSQLEYLPAPLDTSSIELDASLNALVERLAENLHNVWARKRLDEGWSYGPARNDASKQHPMLVPYNALPDSEKEYDRAMVVSTLKPLLKLGFTIHAPAAGPISFEALAQAETTAALAVRDQIASANSVAALSELWTERDPALWDDHPELAAAFAQRLLRMGEVLLAYEAIADGLRAAPRDLRLRQLQGWALHRSGALDHAIAVLTELRQEGGQTPEQMEETVGILGGALKTQAARAQDTAGATKVYQRAHATYHAAFRLSHGYYSGINAATTALLAGSESAAREIAAEVRDICLRLVGETPAPGDRYYVFATLGEAELLLGNLADADSWYNRAVQAAGDRAADIASTRRNAMLIVSALGSGQSIVENTLKLPRVGAFANAAALRDALPAPATQEAIGEELRRLLDTKDIRFGYSCAIEPVDVLFLEAAQARGPTTVVLPFCTDELMSRYRSIDGVDDEWVRRLANVTSAAAERVVATEHRFALGDDAASDDVLVEYAKRLAVGLAWLQANALGAELLIMSDTTSGAGSSSAPAQSVECCSDVREADPAPAASTRICSIIFADAVHSSSLTDEQQPVFIEQFMGAIGGLIIASGCTPLTRNTWGDGLYLVFGGVQDAGRFALELRDLVRNTDWSVHGLPANLSLRIGVHTGPVFAYRDPVTDTMNYTGRHTIRAARIEPVTAPDAVYATREFAALSALECPRTFTFDPVGRVALAKKSGSVPLFALDWGTA